MLARRSVVVLTTAIITALLAVVLITSSPTMAAEEPSGDSDKSSAKTSTDESAASDDESKAGDESEGASGGGAGSANKYAQETVCVGSGGIWQGNTCKEDTKNAPALLPSITIIVNTLLFLAGMIAVIVIIIAGVRFVAANGESAQVSKARQTLVFAVIGLVIVFMAFAIVNFVSGQLEKGSSSTSTSKDKDKDKDKEKDKEGGKEKEKEGAKGGDG